MKFPLLPTFIKTSPGTHNFPQGIFPRLYSLCPQRTDFLLTPGIHSFL